MPDPKLDAFWSMIDGVLAINLDQRPDRWNDLQTRTADLIPAGKLQRLPATPGASLPGYGMLPWFRGRPRDKTWAGRAGCTLSHRNAIAHARQAGWRTVLILEDDIEQASGLVAVLAALAEAMQQHTCDVCYLGFTDPVSPFRSLVRLPDGHELCQVFGCNTAHAYLLRESTYDWLLQRLPQPSNIWHWISRHRAIDRWYYRNLARRFTVCAVTPAVINQQGGFSDITQREHERNYLTEVPAERNSATGFRLLGALRWLGFRLAEPRDWLRGQVKRTRGF